VGLAEKLLLALTFDEIFRSLADLAHPPELDTHYYSSLPVLGGGGSAALCMRRISGGSNAGIAFGPGDA